VAAKPRSVARIAWDGDLKFSATRSKTSTSLDNAAITPLRVRAGNTARGGSMRQDFDLTVTFELLA
jgi:hypothetical protein